MTVPWLEIKQVHDQQVPPGPSSSEYIWQAMFACQVEVLPHKEWTRLKWGWNVSALFDEANERQRLFLESQYSVRTDVKVEPPDRRTLAFRFINQPEEGLRLAVIAKVHARSEAAARECGMAYFTELKSTFPYDYGLAPAASKQEFLQVCGGDLLNPTNRLVHLAQIKRVEQPIQPSRNSPFLQGFWRSAPRAHEQIWRLLAGYPFPLLLNISLRSTLLYEKECERLLMVGDEIANHQGALVNPITLAALKQWNKDYMERRLRSWKKFFYLQIHLASPQALAENICRAIAASVTLSSMGEANPGYLVIAPRNGEDQSWQNRLMELELIFSDSHLSVPRLSEVADMDEVFEVIRLPYPAPDNGIPGVKFLTSRMK